MKKIVLALVILPTLVFGGSYKYIHGTATHAASTASGTANKQDSTDIWIGDTEACNNIVSYVYIGAAKTSTLDPFTKRGFGLLDSALVRVLTRGVEMGTVIIRSSAMAVSIPKTIQFDSLMSDTTFHGQIGFRIITSDSLSDSTVTGLSYPIRYEVILKD